MSSRSIAVRLFWSCWLLYTLHFATNIVRDLYLAVAIGEPGSAGEGECRLDSIEVRLPGRRRQVREFSVISLLGLLRRHLLET